MIWLICFIFALPVDVQPWSSKVFISILLSRVPHPPTSKTKQCVACVVHCILLSVFGFTRWAATVHLTFEETPENASSCINSVWPFKLWRRKIDTTYCCISLANSCPSSQDLRLSWGLSKIFFFHFSLVHHPHLITRTCRIIKLGEVCFLVQFVQGKMLCWRI